MNREGIGTKGMLDYVKYDEHAAKVQAELKADFETIVARVSLRVKPGRAHSLFITKIEEAYMWLGKAIRDDQIERNGIVELQEERKDG